MQKYIINKDLMWTSKEDFCPVLYPGRRSTII